MKLTLGKDFMLILGLMAFLAGCATDSRLRGHLITEIYPAFNAFNLPFYVYYTPDRFESDKLPEIKKCLMQEDGSFQIILAPSSGNDRYLVVNRFGRIIQAKGFDPKDRN